MINKPEVRSIEKLLGQDFTGAAVWTHKSLETIVGDNFNLPITYKNSSPGPGMASLIVIGGGELIDRAKIWRKENSPGTELIAIPSIWGSGAENSPLAIVNQDGVKVIYKGPEYLPDVRAIWRELAETIPPHLARWACGDVWAHALEGFFSPLADDTVRDFLAGVIRTIIELPIENTPEWFQPSALACYGQSNSSVGLVHGISHTLEGILKQELPGEYWGHAQLCSLFLWPVFSLNFKSNITGSLLEAYKLDGDRINAALAGFFDRNMYSKVLPILEKNWKSVLRNPSSRTNCTLVRPDCLSHFTEGAFL